MEFKVDEIIKYIIFGSRDDVIMSGIPGQGIKDHQFGGLIKLEVNLETKALITWSSSLFFNKLIS